MTRNITIAITGGGATLTVCRKAAKVTSSKDKTVVDTKDLTLYLWVVPKAKTVAEAVPKVATVISGEFKDFVVQRTNTITVAGAEAKHLVGRGRKPMTATRARRTSWVFTVGKTVLAACVHGEGETAPQQRPAMLAMLKTVKAP